MKKSYLVLLFIILPTLPRAETPLYPQNRPPLRARPYLELPLGAIEPRGWLKQQLELMAQGMSGHLDELYRPVVGPRNGWLGGDGDGWERGPYWIDGLLPLAYLLKDPALIEKTRPWIEWAIASQQSDGYFGPEELTDPAPEPGLQKTMRRDWWPKMVMLKVLMQYYSATGDRRVIELMRRYFAYQRTQLPQTPLDHWTIWANRRGGDNLLAVLWLYTLTGESDLLQLADLLQEQTFPWSRVFLNDRPDDFFSVFGDGDPWIYGRIRYPWKDQEINALSLKTLRSFHCVNLSQGLKQPAVYYQRRPDQNYLTAIDHALADLQRYHGQPQGMFGGDEPLHGPAPTQGVELCAVVEMMYSLETMLPITGEPALADHLERIAYNALPTQVSDDFSSRQYFQQANQVLINRDRRNFYETENHGHTDLCFGLLTGYPCCTCNLHQGWPKLTQNLWYATPDRGLAALIYGPSQVTARVGDGREVTIREETDYPFSETVRFIFSLQPSSRFPLILRTPGWCDSAAVYINGVRHPTKPARGVIRLHRQWRDGDVVELHLPAQVRISRRADAAAAVERGPLVFSLRIGEIWKTVHSADKWGDYQEVYPADAWNFGLVESAVLKPDSGFAVHRPSWHGRYPWTLDAAPIRLTVKGRRIPEWQLYMNSAGPLPASPVTHLKKEAAVELTLVPYGCSTLRISEFPVVQ